MSVRLLFDTSVWIEFLNRKNTPAADLLEKTILEEEQVFLTPTILQEILQGIRDDSKFEQIKETLSYFTILQLPHIPAAIASAQLYRSLRKKGATIRKSNDCLIAHYAMEFKLTLVHGDSDFDLIAKYSRLKVWNPL
jgi:predicted nucleic acid-binding protein